jgi:hypothetical protein
MKRREYFQKYYKDHPEKYASKIKGYDSCFIYKLFSPDTNRIYIGATPTPLQCRLAHHLAAMYTGKSATYQEMAELSGRWSIEPLVTCSVTGRAQLEMLETIWITAFSDIALNRSKKYSVFAIQHLFDGRFPDKYLPEKFRKKGLDLTMSAGGG